MEVVMLRAKAIIHGAWHDYPSGSYISCSPTPDWCFGVLRRFKRIIIEIKVTAMP